MTSLNPMVEEIIFGHISRIYRTLDNHLPSHGPSVDDLDQVHEILFVLEAADKLGVIWRAEGENKVSMTLLFIYYSVCIFCSCGKYVKPASQELCDVD